jgi:hypothetical protein
MASIILPVYRLENHNHNGKNGNGAPAKTYLIRYKCGKCSNIHSVRVKVKIVKDEIQFTYPPKAKMKVRVWMEKGVPKEMTMLLGAMKTLDGLNIKYLPETVRLVKV